jgi:hypothetical protein
MRHLHKQAPRPTLLQARIAGSGRKKVNLDV